MKTDTSQPASNDSIGSKVYKSCLQAFHSYASWLVGISWKRFFGLSLLLIIAVAILKDVPPLSLTYTEMVASDKPWQIHVHKTPPAPPLPPKSGAAEKEQGGADSVDISIDERGVHITTKAGAPATATSGAASGPATTNSAQVNINLPAGADSQAVKDAIEEARKGIVEALEQARQEARDAAEAAAEEQTPHFRTHTYGDPLMPLTMWFILISMIIKITYKGKVQAEAKAAQATEVAESESLKRQVVEARMAAMQAQVEPHFLFNTLASIEHLIETDPPRAGRMQRNLIDLLRATMPTMREANAQTVRDLGRELAVIRPYLEILKVRMEERLQTELHVSDGLLSAEFPPMMLQSLVENAIKHGLEPKAEGGQLTVSAEIVHGKLAVTVADTGLGFGKAATAGTGIGLSNIRERLALLYGNKASLTVTEPPGGGTLVTITLPYVVHTATES
jgi:signal transduction histidine kinase